MTATAPFDPLRALRELRDAGVEFVIIGAFAARLIGSPTVTRDLDVCHATEQSNLQALAAVLVGLGARLRGADPDLPFRLDARTLAAGDRFTFVTDAGDLDILATPSGTGGFADLVRTSVRTDLGDGLIVRVASIDDLIRMKSAAGRPKDLIELEVLGALRDELDRLGRP